MKITLIAALAKGSRAIGFENKLPWHLPADLKYFKELTMGHTMLMGNNTLKSFPKLLPGRPHWVLSENAENAQNTSSDSLRFFDSLESALRAAKEQALTDLFIIGGAKVYSQTIHIATDMLLTEVDLHTSEISADAFFPEFDEEKWEKKEILHREADEKNAFPTTVYHYKRK